MTNNLYSSDVKDLDILPYQKLFPNFHHPIVIINLQSHCKQQVYFDLAQKIRLIWAE